ncbi:MAG TPA: hypothetical protein VMS96_11260 [Terriglobales bacterium]|nr:hypothetical protein [Terriglobales bacterium]
MRYALVLCLAAAAMFAQQAPPSQQAPADLTGMYTFLQDGEFVQLSVQDGRLSGFISRYEDGEKSLFVDQFFSETTLNGMELSFKTKIVHGVWFEFKGGVERGPGKTRAEEAYYVVRGTLVRYTEDANKKATAQTREASFKSFPQEAEGEPPPRK